MHATDITDCVYFKTLREKISIYTKKVWKYRNANKDYACQLFLKLSAFLYRSSYI